MSTDPDALRARARAACALLFLCFSLASGAARGQSSDGGTEAQAPEPAAPAPAAGEEEQESSLDDTIEAGEADAEEPRRKFTKWNEYEGPYFKIRLGAGFLFEGATYLQDEESQQQFELEPAVKVRDARFLLKGSFPTFPRLSWSMGLMYDGPTKQWLFRETGLMIAVPELWGHFFVGRTKEGFSLNKVMVGYAGWTMERATMNDASIPILADGVKWLGYVEDWGLLWNLGVYTDFLSKEQAFSTYQNQAVARIAWLPVASVETGTLVHLGLNFRYGVPDAHELRLRSRPEAFPAPYFLDTGPLQASNTRMVALEAYYRPGPWLFGTEYFVQQASSAPAGDPIFHGGDVAVTWLITGETRAYNTRGGFFKQVSPSTTVLEGGPGAWELVGRVSYSDFDDGPIQGGRFVRVTPMVNWHLSDHVRLELAYGYGWLNRFGLQGATQFFQSRIQLQL